MKPGSPSVVIGMSGGVDFALTAAVGSDALGPQRVNAVMTPSPYTNRASLDDAEACATALGLRYDIIDIAPAMKVKAFESMLQPLFGDRMVDVTEENLQSRARGVALVAISNKLGGMVVTTGNKAEMAVGYATHYRKPPSAPLRPDQKDEDSSPPYPVLDAISTPQRLRRKAMSTRRSTASGACSKGPSTTADKLRLASRYPRATSVASGAIPS